MVRGRVIRRRIAGEGMLVLRSLNEVAPLIGIADDFEPPSAQLVTGILRSREGRRIGSGLSAVPGKCGLSHHEVGKSEEEET